MVVIRNAQLSVGILQLALTRSLSKRKNNLGGYYARNYGE